jgi:tetratricopeptide (TPR) repeat protein
LKPGNIHLQPSGHVKILDFGLARAGASDLTKTGTVMGTPHYMSPEQVRGQKADARSDVFSLGSVFYELLSHHRPFEAESVHGVLLQILEHEPESIRKWEPEVPAACVAFVERALSKDPAGRYADAGEMLRSLIEVRESFGGETLIGGFGSQADQTMVQGADATLLEPAAAAAAASVRGATALTLVRSPARRGDTHLPQTVRPEPTLSGSVTAAYPRSRMWLVAGSAAGVVVLAVAAGLLWKRSQPAPVALPAAAEVQQQQLGILTDALVTSQVELARTDLAKHDYTAAAQHAEGVLKLSAGNADAKEVLEQARQAQQKLDAAAAEARAAYARGDTGAAADALSRVIALDSRHPVVGELSSELNRAFRRQAELSRRLTETARTAAEQARAAALTGFADGRQLVAAGETSFKREEFTVAAQKYEQARIAFEGAKREADDARAAAAARAAQAAHPQPSTRPTAIAEAPSPTTLAARPAASSVPSPLAPSSTPLGSPVPAPTSAVLTPAPPLAAAASPYATAAAGGDATQAGVRRAIFENYKRAIESQDIALFRSVKPDLSQDEERRLRESFKVIKSWVVGMVEEGIQVDPSGDRATVRVSRQDVVNGRPTQRFSQTFHLVRSGGGWQIQSMGQ